MPPAGRSGAANAGLRPREMIRGMTVRALSVSSAEPYEGGTSFGDAGPYELIHGLAHIGLDPGDPANARVVDLASAARDGDGLVRVSADVVLLRPADPRRGNGSLLYTVANRGDVSIPLALGASPRDPYGALPPRDGFLLRDGWTLAWSGWQFDVARGPGRVAIDVPEARVPAGRTRARLTPLARDRSCVLADWTASMMGPGEAVYPAAEPYDQAVLTVADNPEGPWRVVDRERWRFARDERGVPCPDPGHVWLDDGFLPGLLYEVVYTTARCPVVGAGLAAVRDVVAHLREREESEHVIGFGVSQSGRFLRQFLYEGLNVDERGRTVFDGVLCHRAGARRGEFNHRYAMPSEAFAPGFGDLPPFAADELLERQREIGGAPKLVEVNGSWEYWRGDAALGHVRPDGSADLPEPDDARSYLIAGSDHVGEAPGSGYLFRTVNPENGLDHNPAVRALLLALHAWLTDGTPPPPSRVPSLADGTAVSRSEVLRQVAGIPGLERPEALPSPHRLDLGPDAADGVAAFPPVIGEAYPCLVASVDADGNETCGIVLPENAVPLATRTGWNTTKNTPKPLALMVGSRVPFPLNPSSDPRPSLGERYPDRDDYDRRVRAAADALVRDRLLLPGDVPYVIAKALRRYDTAVKPRDGGR